MNADVLIIGGGIAGAAVAYHLASRCRVVLVEREEGFGAHATGRSAAEWSTLHASGLTRALTSLSEDFLSSPPESFSEYPLLETRGNVVIARPGDEPVLERLRLESEGEVAGLSWIGTQEALRLSPFLQPEIVGRALYDPANCTIDVDGLLHGYLRAARKAGASTLAGVGVLRGVRAGDAWQVETSAGPIFAPVVVNAAGAWADEMAQRFGAEPLGLVPRRRTAITFDVADGVDLRGAASVDDVGLGAYLKPEGGRLMASPGDATDAEPCDAAPEEIDVATAAWVAEELTGKPISRIVSRWAGLRTFTPDGHAVAGWDAAATGFFWLAGLGGAGLMTSPALSEAAASILLGEPPPGVFLARGIDAAALSPSRLRAA